MILLIIYCIYFNFPSHTSSIPSSPPAGIPVGIWTSYWPMMQPVLACWPPCGSRQSLTKYSRSIVGMKCAQAGLRFKHQIRSVFLILRIKFGLFLYLTDGILSGFCFGVQSAHETKYFVSQTFVLSVYVMPHC